MSPNSRKDVDAVTLNSSYFTYLSLSHTEQERFKLYGTNKQVSSCKRIRNRGIEDHPFPAELRVQGECSKN